MPDAPALPDDVPPAQDDGVPKRIRGEKSPQIATRFPEFWATYPVKKGRAKALAKWKAKGLDALADKLIAHVRRMEAEDDQWKRGFIPHGDTYINGERWTDEPQKEKGAITVPPPDPSKIGAKAAFVSSETPLERDVNWIRQQHHYGNIDADEMRRQIADAIEKHRKAGGHAATVSEGAR